VTTPVYPGQVNELRKKAYTDLVARVMVARAAVVFLAAESVNYWQAWVFLAVNTVGEFRTTRYLVRHDPELLKRRLRGAPAAEVRSNQKRMSLLARLAFFIALLVSALDHRNHWSHVPTVVSLLGDVVVAGGLAIVWLSFRANSFAAAIVDVEADQQVVSSGPYALVRHPMYTGLITMMIGMSPALGSWWGLSAVAVVGLTLVARLLDEERFLANNLAGYEEYRTRVRHRLAPLVW
jgi:protein-S-isoprenylcysteine O-methyltransferase Ste14